ncbi:uncharacterized protein [Aegilops tauschii subsp. strangulata]|uniref:uncharacterized protein n=1 Tax=Aegilops tauschii subsp. strangulata TaxID=200361 RepID=UPI003CC868DB
MAIDVLDSLLAHAHRRGLLQCLTARHAASSISIYADDVVVFCHPSSRDPRVIRELLRVFGAASGLCTNFSKCSATPIQCGEDEIACIQSELACAVVGFHIIYLGIPLSVRKPSASSLLPIVEKLSKKLSTWRATLLSRGERLALVRHVLYVIPSHIMVAIAICSPVLKQVNRIIREFLWHGRKDTQSGHDPVNWQRVCRPLELGGLGIQNLHRQGIALRVRWLWLQRTDPTRPWAHLYLPSDPDASAIFRASTFWDVGDGRTCRF